MPEEPVSIDSKYLPELRPDVGVQGLRNDFASHLEVLPAHEFEKDWREGWIVYGDLIGIAALTQFGTKAPLNHIVKFQALCVEASQSVSPIAFTQFSDSTFAIFSTLADALRFLTRLLHTCMALNWDTTERRVTAFHEMVVPSFGVAKGRFFLGRIKGKDDESAARFEPLRVILGSGVTHAVHLQQNALMGTALVEADAEAWEDVSLSDDGKKISLSRWKAAQVRAAREENPPSGNRAWAALELVNAGPTLFPWFLAAAHQARAGLVEAARIGEVRLTYAGLRRVNKVWLDSFYAAADVPPKVAKHGLGFARFVASSYSAAIQANLVDVRPQDWRHYLDIR